MEDETDYLIVLNRSLPDDIRVMGWTDVPDDFSSRFSCTGRTYRYFFPGRTYNIAVCMWVFACVQPST